MSLGGHFEVVGVCEVAVGYCGGGWVVSGRYGRCVGRSQFFESRSREMIWLNKPYCLWSWGGDR